MKDLVDYGFQHRPAGQPLVNEDLPLELFVLRVWQISPAGGLTPQFRESQEPLFAVNGEVVVVWHGA